MRKALTIVFDDKREEYAAAVRLLAEQEIYNETLVDDLANALDFARYAETRAEIEHAHALRCDVEISRLRCIIELLLIAASARRHLGPTTRFRSDALTLAQRSDIDELDARSCA